MTFDPNQVISFNFSDVEPIEPGDFQRLPEGTYQVQCISVRGFFTGENKGEPDPNKPNAEFLFKIIQHPLYTGQELKLSHSLTHPGSRGFLLNTLMCLNDTLPWQSNIQVPFGKLIQACQGKTANAVCKYESFVSTQPATAGQTVWTFKVKGLKKFDPTLPPPMPDENNPPPHVLGPGPAPSPVGQQAAAGVSTQEMQNFMGDWPSGNPTTTAPSQPSNPAPGNFDFLDEPF